MANKGAIGLGIAGDDCCIQKLLPVILTVDLAEYIFLFC